MADQPDYTRAIVISSEVAQNLILQVSTTVTTSQVTAGVAQILLAAASANRKILGIVYTGSQQIYIGPLGVTTSTGFRIPSNTVLYISAFTGALYVIANAAAQTVGVIEFT